jgi:leader peptidase (prepilin peptidase) / N-methyltransferase
LLTSATLVFAAPLGLAIGSFLNVVAYRLPRKESVSKPRSRCTSCGEQIRALDNLPVLSWLLLRGRCRACGTSISARYPAIELLTAVVFAAMLIAVASIDAEHKIVPNKVLLPAAAWGVAGAALFRTSHLPELLLSGAGAFLALLIVALIHPGGMGMGDVKLVGVMGLYLGTSVLPALLIGFLTGTLAGLVLFARYGMAARKVGVPFAPFLALGGLVALLAGHDLIHAYAQTLH